MEARSGRCGFGIGRMRARCLVWCISIVAGAGTAWAQAGDAGPDLSVGVDRYPDADAIILRWEQEWKVEKDGTVHRREHKWLKLLNSRPVRREADPRIDFEEGRDRVIIHAARTHLPNGDILPVPEYSFNIAAPNDVAGWPEYAAWRQQVVSFSGIEADVVLELDYEVVTAAGVMPWVEADLRLEQDYPTVQRVITVTLPEGARLQHRVDGAALGADGFKETRSRGMVTRRWSFSDLPGARGEPQSPIWEQRCARLRFTSGATAAGWVGRLTSEVERAATAGERIRSFSEGVVDGETEAAQQVRKVADKLKDTFNFVNSAKTMRSVRCRGAEEVFRSNYGNRLESAAVLAAALGSLGMEVGFAVAVDARVWDEEVPTSSALAGVVVSVKAGDEWLHVHPQHGVIHNPGDWGRHWLLRADGRAAMGKTYVYGRGEAKPSELHVTGKIIIDADGRASGELRLRLTGLFYDPQKLETADAQKKLVSGLAGRVLSGFEVEGHSIATLSDESLRATVSVATKDELKRLGELRVLTFGKGPAALKAVPLPLSRSYRRTAVQAQGRFREHVDVTVELPDGWEASIVPGSMSRVAGDWGWASQTVTVGDDGAVRFVRDLALMSETVEAKDFESLRRAVNNLRTTSRRVLGVCAGSGSGDGL